MRINHKSFIIGVGIFILGGIVGGLVFTRHYGVGPLAALQGVQSSADGPRAKIGGTFNQCPSGYGFYGIVPGSSNPYGISYMVCIRDNDVQVVVLN